MTHGSFSICLFSLSFLLIKCLIGKTAASIEILSLTVRLSRKILGVFLQFTQRFGGLYCLTN